MARSLSSFVGREAELAELSGLVRALRLVTVVGTGGVGKTRLVDETCSALSAHFAGGILRCDLAELPSAPAAHDPEQLAGALGFPSLAALLLAAASAPMLLVLDGCEHVRRAAAALCERLLAESETLQLLATSREPLGVDGEHVTPLEPLRLPDSSDLVAQHEAPATKLFMDRARAAGARLDASPAELAARALLCRRLDGIPLAIELAAARARSLTAVELLGMLDRRFDLLQREAPIGRARHRSLRAGIDASYALLDAEERRFFRALGVFVGPFSAELAHAVAAAPGADLLRTLDGLARLTDRSLLVATASGGTTRFRLLDSLRAYAEEQAAAEGERDALHERFLAAMTGTARRIAREGRERWSSQLMATVLSHFEGFVSAIDAAIARDPDARRAFTLLLPLWAAVQQGRASDVAAAANRVFEHWPRGIEPQRGLALAVAAGAHLMAGNERRAQELEQRALEHAAQGDELARMLALRTRGVAMHLRGESQAALASFREAREIAVRLGIAAFARELGGLSEAVRSDGALDASLTALAALAEEGERAGDVVALVWNQLAAARALLRARRLGEARAQLARVSSAQERFAHSYGRAGLLRLSAVLETLERGWEESRPAWIRAIDSCASSGDVAGLASALHDAATLAAQAGDASSKALRAAMPQPPYVMVLGPVFDGISARAAPLGAEHLSTEARLRDVRAALSRSAPKRAAHATDRSDEPGAELVKSGALWRVRFGEREAQLRHMKGLADLAALVARPGEAFHCLELMGAADVGDAAAPALDERARRTYQARVRDLQREVDDARAANDPGRAERAERELDALVEQLASAFGLGGRARRSGGAAERARSAVTWRVRAAIRRLAEHDPALGRHLENAVRTGAWCSYQPETPVRWRTS